MMPPNAERPTSCRMQGVESHTFQKAAKQFHLTPRNRRMLRAIAAAGTNGILSIDLARIGGYTHAPRGVINLRGKGWNIITRMVDFTDRDGRKTKLARYSLLPEQRAQAAREIAE